MSVIGITKMPQNKPMESTYQSDRHQRSPYNSHFLSYCFFCYSFSNCSVCLCPYMPIHVSILLKSCWKKCLLLSRSMTKKHTKWRNDLWAGWESIANIVNPVLSVNCNDCHPKINVIEPNTYVGWLIIYLFSWQKIKNIHSHQKSKFIEWYFVLSGRSLIPFHTMAQCHS